MGKRRNTAKTGDKAVYNSRSSHSSGRDEKHVTDDSYLRLEESQDDASIQGSEGEEIAVKHDVMDLGIGGDSDSSDGDSSSEDEDDEGMRGNPQDDAVDGENDEDSSGSDSEDDLDQPSDLRHWGNKKSSYYHGDTGDIEIGQNEEDAFDEEAAAKEVESSRFQEMDEGDFMLPDEGDDADPATSRSQSSEAQASVATVRDVSKLSTKDKRKFIKKQHPELLPLASFFSDVCKELRDTTQVATNILTRNNQTVESVGASLEGQQYLLTKSLLGNSTALNAAIYLLLKSDIEEIDRDNSIGEKSSSSIQAHPVMAQLQKCNTSDERFKEEVTGQVKNIDDQVNYLVKAAALMTSPDQKLDEDSDASTPESEQNDSADENASDSYLNETSDHIEHKSLTVHESSEALKEKEDVLLHEARFGLRASEVNSKSGKGKPKRKSADDTYFGDLEETEAQGNTRFLASTINSIEQRSKKKKKTALVEEIDDTEADSGLAQGLKMMEEELGKLERNDDKVGDFDKDKEVYDDNMASVEGSNEGAMKFYNAVANRSKEKKMIKKKRYQVAPKFPVTDAEVPGERAISKAIMKNRGLVPHKAKINRNPRVKKREQYRKALIRRKGAVREIRTDEGHKYGGEGTGIKSAISRSRKL